MKRGTLSRPPLKNEAIGRILKRAHPEIRDMLRCAHDQHYIVTATRGNHYKISTPPGRPEPTSVFAPKTPSDTRGLHRVRAKLRRIGVDI